MIAQITIVDWENSTLQDRSGEAIVFSFTKNDVDLGAEDAVLADLLAQYNEAEDMREGWLTCNARMKYESVRMQAFLADNPVLEMLCLHQCALTLDYSEQVLKALEELDARIQETFASYQDCNACAMRFTASLETLQEHVRHNILHYRALVMGRLCVARLNVIDEMMAEQCFDRAEYFAQSSAAQVAETLGECHWWRGILLMRQTRCLLALNKRDDAQKAFTTAQSILVEWCCAEHHPLAGELADLNSLWNQLARPVDML
jgi:hypothetical protein